MTPRALWLCLPVGVLLLVAPAGADDAIGYNDDVRPILADNCFSCHGPDSASRKAGLRLDRREAAVEMGAIVPGKPAESELVTRIMSADADSIMPPASSHKTLTPAQKKVLTDWIAAGATYQPHWSLIAPASPAPARSAEQGVAQKRDRSLCLGAGRSRRVAARPRG